MTSTALADMNDNSATIKVTGEDTSGATITEKFNCY